MEGESAYAFFDTVVSHRAVSGAFSSSSETEHEIDGARDEHRLHFSLFHAACSHCLVYRWPLQPRRRQQPLPLRLHDVFFAALSVSGIIEAHTPPHQTHSSLTLAPVARQELRLHTMVTSSMSKMRRESGGIPASGTPFLPYAQAGSIVTVALSPVAMSRTASSQPRITWCVRANVCQDIRCVSLCTWAQVTWFEPTLNMSAAPFRFLALSHASSTVESKMVPSSSLPV